jgi:hypothetical protein
LSEDVKFKVDCEMSNQINLSNLYLVKYDTRYFSANSLVRLSAFIGPQCLAIDLDDDRKREWIAKYDLYPVSVDEYELSGSWKYNAKLSAVAMSMASARGF